MAKTAAIYVKIEPEVKKEAEQVMSQLGLSASSVINMLYRQIAMEKRIPFQSRISVNDEGYPTRDGAVDPSLMNEEQLARFRQELIDMLNNDDYTDYITMDELKKHMDEVIKQTDNRLQSSSVAPSH